MKKIDSVKATGSADIAEWTIGDVFRNREAILANPEEFGRIITHFSAGGLGACAYNKEVSISQLSRCWQHVEYRHKCPECGHESYIYFFAGHVNGGGYWQIIVYCPECDCSYSFSRPQGLYHWTVLKNIFNQEALTVNNNLEQKMK